MPSQSPRIPTNTLAVVVVTWNSASHAAPFAAGLRDGTSGLPDWSLVVADNASSDDSVDAFTAAVPGAKVVQLGHNAGYAAAINAAIAEIPDGVGVLVVNPDIRFTSGAVTRLLETATSTGAGIVVPLQHDAVGSLLPTLRREPTLARAFGEACLGGTRAGRWPRWGEMVTRPAEYTVAQTADWASGSALLVSPACRLEVGAWDDRFFLYSEETDFCLRAKDLGQALVLEPAATCVHYQGDSHQSPALWRLLVVNRYRLYRSRHSPVAAQLFRAALVLGELLRLVRGTRSQTSRAALRGLLGTEAANLRHIMTLKQGPS